MTGRRGAGVLAVAVALASATLLVFGPAASGHVDPPTVTALHAFIGDPLFGLDTTAGTLFGIAPDERTAMASTTKLMTLDVTLHAVEAGVVHLDDQVAVDPFAASIEPGNSVMADVNGVTLEPGEVVSLETLIRGMMYPSGNDAAWAIAYHVAQAYGADLDGNGIVDGNDFVVRMNQHAAAIGLVDTHYPGWEGEKGGSTQNCNGLPNRFCLAVSARRIGRRVVASFMQGVGGSEVAGMLDYGFAQIFHPDPRGASASVGSATREDTVCPSSSRCVSAVLPASGDMKLVSWQPDLDGSSIGILDQASLPGSALPPKGKGGGQGPAGDVALTELPSGAIVMATRKGSSVDLSRWTMDAGGTLTLLASKAKLGPAATIDLQPVSGDMFLSAVTDPDGALVLRSWKLDGSSLAKLDTYRDESRQYSELSMAGPLTPDVFNGHRAVTAAVAPGVLVHDVWGVDQTSGAITRLGELVEAGDRDDVQITPFSVPVSSNEPSAPTYYATAFRYPQGYALAFYRIDGSGAPVDEGAFSTFNQVEDVGVAGLGVGGVLTASLQGDGTVELRAWEARRNADDTISSAQVSQHTGPNAGSLELVRVPSTHAEGDYVTAVTDPQSGELSLLGYRSGDRPY
jgi:D-alanyl-D-alanine carboxypeptidase